MHNYILNEKNEPVVERDVLKWGKWFETANRHVGKDEIGDVRISTVFLGMDHGFSYADQGNPILWETMIFGGPNDQWMDRYDSLEAAKKGHEKAVEAVKSRTQL